MRTENVDASLRTCMKTAVSRSTGVLPVSRTAVPAVAITGFRGFHRRDARGTHGRDAPATAFMHVLRPLGREHEDNDVAYLSANLPKLEKLIAELQEKQFKLADLAYRARSIRDRLVGNRKG